MIKDIATKLFGVTVEEQTSETEVIIWNNYFQFAFKIDLIGSNHVIISDDKEFDFDLELKAEFTGEHLKYYKHQLLSKRDPISLQKLLWLTKVLKAEVNLDWPVENTTNQFKEWFATCIR